MYKIKDNNFWSVYPQNNKSHHISNKHTNKKLDAGLWFDQLNALAAGVQIVEYIIPGYQAKIKHILVVLPSA